uniref:BED-type domain-containing protein n=1 Tax=Panagrellus redivivus TaxID=6233 RepID=A0A7E4WC65_PANRE
MDQPGPPLTPSRSNLLPPHTSADQPSSPLERLDPQRLREQAVALHLGSTMQGISPDKHWSPLGPNVNVNSPTRSIQSPMAVNHQRQSGGSVESLQHYSNQQFFPTSNDVNYGMAPGQEYPKNQMQSPSIAGSVSVQLGSPSIMPQSPYIARTPNPTAQSPIPPNPRQLPPYPGMMINNGQPNYAQQTPTTPGTPGTPQRLPYQMGQGGPFNYPPNQPPQPQWPNVTLQQQQQQQQSQHQHFVAPVRMTQQPIPRAAVHRFNAAYNGQNVPQSPLGYGTIPGSPTPRMAGVRQQYQQVVTSQPQQVPTPLAQQAIQPQTPQTPTPHTPGIPTAPNAAGVAQPTGFYPPPGYPSNYQQSSQQAYQQRPQTPQPAQIRPFVAGANAAQDPDLKEGSGSKRPGSETSEPEAPKAKIRRRNRSRRLRRVTVRSGSGSGGSELNGSATKFETDANKPSHTRIQTHSSADPCRHRGLCAYSIYEKKRSNSKIRAPVFVNNFRLRLRSCAFLNRPQRQFFVAKMSDVYQHFIEDGDKFKCHYCPSRLTKPGGGSTGSLWKHYNTRHNPSRTKSNHDESNPPVNKKQRTLDACVAPTVNRDEVVVRFLSEHGLPFSIVESDSFHDLMKSGGTSYKPMTRQHVSDKALPQTAAAYRLATLQKLHGKTLGIAFDEYSNATSRFLTVTGRVVDKSGFQTVRIHVSDLADKRATAEFIAQKVTESIDLYGVKHVVAATRDGAATAKKACRLMSYESVHCFCHWLELSVRDGLDDGTVVQSLAPFRSVVTKVTRSAKNRQILKKFLKKSLKKNSSISKLCLDTKM